MVRTLTEERKVVVVWKWRWWCDSYGEELRKRMVDVCSCQDIDSRRDKLLWSGNGYGGVMVKS